MVIIIDYVLSAFSMRWLILDVHIHFIKLTMVGGASAQTSESGEGMNHALNVLPSVLQGKFTQSFCFKSDTRLSQGPMGAPGKAGNGGKRGRKV